MKNAQLSINSMKLIFLIETQTRDHQKPESRYYLNKTKTTVIASLVYALPLTSSLYRLILANQMNDWIKPTTKKKIKKNETRITNAHLQQQKKKFNLKALCIIFG